MCDELVAGSRYSLVLVGDMGYVLEEFNYAVVIFPDFLLGY